MTLPALQSVPFQCAGRVTGNAAVCRGLLRLDVTLDRDLVFCPGQFAMLNLTGASALVFSRPYSILAADGRSVSFLYRVVGRGSAALAAMAPGRTLTFLGPLGRPFPPAQDGIPAVLVAGGVGLPPLSAWLDRYGRPGDLACFGARDPGDVPWDLLAGRWRVAVESTAGLETGRAVRAGLVTDLVREQCLKQAESGPGSLRAVLACGPSAMLRAAADLAATARWDCWVSLEEHMGCGYGVCKGCVVPVLEAPGESRGSPTGWRYATCCQDGPVFRAADLAWAQMADASGSGR